MTEPGFAPGSWPRLLHAWMSEPQRSPNLRLGDSQSRGRWEGGRGSDGWWLPSPPPASRLSTPWTPPHSLGALKLQNDLLPWPENLPSPGAEQQVCEQKKRFSSPHLAGYCPPRAHPTQTITLQISDCYPRKEKMEVRFSVALPFPYISDTSLENI